MSSGYRECDGIYTSLYPPVQIPQYPHIDFVTYMFSGRFGRPENANRCALIDGKSGKSLTCSQLRESISRLASQLQDRGIHHGDVVLILLPNCLEFPIIFNAVLTIGGVVATSNPVNTELEISRQILDSKPKMIFTNPSVAHKVRSSGIPVILVDEHAISFSGIPLASPEKKTIARIRQSDPAVILYSSGTTGLSKGVVLSHSNLIALMTVAVCSRPVEEMHDPDETKLVLFPMYHIGGLFWLACGAVSGGPTLVLLRKYTLDDLLGAVQNYQVNSIVTAPPVILELVKSGKTANYDLRSLTSVMSAAAPLGRDLVEGMMAKFPHVKTFVQCYGMTETTVVGTGGRGLLGSSGRLKPTLEAKVVNPQTNKALPPNGRGELWLRGQTIMQGYLNNPVATAEAIDEKGWLHTGDLVYFDDGGYMYVVDRLKELIKYKGYQVAPAELEALLLTHPSIVDCAVVPFPDELAGEIPHAFVVKNPQRSLSSEEVINFISSQVAPYKKVRKVTFLKQIPKSPAGKILRRELKLSAQSKL